MAKIKFEIWHFVLLHQNFLLWSTYIEVFEKFVNLSCQGLVKLGFECMLQC